MSDTLGNSPGEIIQQLLVDLGLGTLPSAGGSWPIYSPLEPEADVSGDDVITVRHAAGLLGDSSQVDGQRWSYPGVQVRVRCADHAIGYKKANDIAVAMDQTINYNTVTLSPSTGTGDLTYRVFSLNRTTDVIDLGRRKEINDCYLFTINALVALEQC